MLEAVGKAAFGSSKAQQLIRFPLWNHQPALALTIETVQGKRGDEGEQDDDIFCSKVNNLCICANGCLAVSWF